MIIIFTLTHLPASSFADDQQYTACGELFQCAKIENIGYPFWGESRPDYCGHPAFRLSCEGDAPLITILSIEYRVLSINKETRTLKVARKDLWDNTCPISFYNSTLDSTLFKLASTDQNLTLYYGCTALWPPLPNQFSCTVNQPIGAAYYTTKSALPSLQ